MKWDKYLLTSAIAAVFIITFFVFLIVWTGQLALIIPLAFFISILIALVIMESDN